MRASGTVLTTTPENWKDSHRHALGANCQNSDNQIATGNGLVSGKYGNKVDILSVQYNHAFQLCVVGFVRHARP